MAGITRYNEVINRMLKGITMKITKLLEQNRLTLSFEVFPPKTDTAFDSVKQATNEIAALSPLFMSVTYGAGGGTSKYTLDIAQNIRECYGVPTVAHLTCVSSSRETVKKKIEQIQNAGIQNIMALRGDIPADMQNDDRSGWDYRHAYELVRELRESGYDFCIGGACYPESHPESGNQTEDIRYLKEKVEAGCDFLTTQMFFDNNLLYRFLYRIRKAGIHVPVIPGIMPITDKKQIERALRLSGSFMPRRFLDLVDKFGDKPAAMKQAGIAYATDQILDLFAAGIGNIHIYTMNKPDIARTIISNLSDVLDK